MAKPEQFLPNRPALAAVPDDQPMGVARAYEILAANLTSYERRKEQEELTHAIAKCLEVPGQTLVAEAPTGTGKSFAVGLGVLATYLGTGKKAVIATANNNLLEQYASKDLPFLQSIFPRMSWARAKGKTHYLCLDKVEREFGQKVLFPENNNLRELSHWCDTTTTGDREEITFKVTEAEWARVNADDSCTGRLCPYYKDCHYYVAKQDVNDADIIVTNMDMVLLEAFASVDLFPTYDALIIDEAHELESRAISRLESNLTERQAIGYLDKAKNRYGVDDPDLYRRIHLSIVELFNLYREQLSYGGPSDERKIIQPTDRVVRLSKEFSDNLDRLGQEVKMYPGDHESLRQKKERENLIKAIHDAAHTVRTSIHEDPRTVSWVEQVGKGVRLVTAPYRVAKKLSWTLFGNPDISVVCLSATLGGGSGAPKMVTAADGSLVPLPRFEQFRKRVGITQAEELQVPSPFNYRAQCLLYLPKPPEGKTDPNSAEWKVWAKQQAAELVQMSKGRALVLTTSSRATQEFADYIWQVTQLPTKAQGGDMTNSRLIEWFKSTANAVMVGTSSFWQGVSIEGDLLKLVIIDRIPFASQGDPIQQAREAWYKSNPKLKDRVFNDLQMFPASIQLAQGFGRLIRTKSDTGVVAMLDPRLTGKPYGKRLLGSLPDCPRTSDMSDPRLVSLLK